MKNLPEKDLFDELENRLRNYSENPDDGAWNKISAAIPNEKGLNGWIWFDRIGGSLVLALALFLLLWNWQGSSSNNQNGKISAAASLSKAISIDGQDSKLIDSISHYDKDVAGAIARKSVDEDSDIKIDQHHSEYVSDKLKQDGSMDQKQSVSLDKKPKQNQSSVNENSNRIKTKNYENNKRKRVINSSNQNSNYQNQNTNSLQENDGEAEYLSHNESQIQISTSVNNRDDIGSQKEGSEVVDNSAKENDVIGNDFIQNNQNRKGTSKPGNDVTTKNQQPDSVITAIQKNDPDEIAKKKRLPKELRVQQKNFKSVVYFMVTPSLAYYKITPLRTDNVTIESLNITSIFNSNRVGLSLEAGYQRQLTSNLEFYAGLSYYTQKQNITYNFRSSDKVEVNSSDDLTFSVSPKHQSNTINYTMHNLGISSGFLYRIKEGKLQHKIGVGLQSQMGMYKSTESSYSNDASTYLNYQIVYRVEFAINQRACFFVQPNINHAIQAQERIKAPLTIKPYRAGIGFGLQYRF